jgi:hypothetical protein
MPIKPLARRRRDFEVTTNLAGKMVIDLGMTRNRRGLPSHRIHEDGVAPSLAQENAPMTLQMVDEVATFQRWAAWSGSRMSACPASCCAIVRLASSTNSTASMRLSRASSRVLPWVFAPGSSSTYPMYPSGTFRKTAVSAMFMVARIARRTLANKPLQQTVVPQGHRVESRQRLGGTPAAERQSVRRTSLR